MSEQGRQVAKVAAWVAGGAAVGAGLGLLFAPQSGTETRRQIRHYAKRARFEATRFGRNVKDRLDQAIEHGKTLVGKRTDRRVIEAA